MITFAIHLAEASAVTGVQLAACLAIYRAAVVRTHAEDVDMRDRACELMDEAADREQRTRAAYEAVCTQKADLHDEREELFRWSQQLKQREEDLRHRAPEPDDEPTPEEPAEAEPAGWAAGHADLPHLHAVYGTEPETVHFESDAIDAGLSQLLDEGCWDQALSRLVALRTPTGSYQVVSNPHLPPGSEDTAKPKAGGDEMPHPLPPTKPVVPAAVAIRQIALAGKAA